MIYYILIYTKIRNQIYNVSVVEKTDRHARASI